MKTTCPQTFVLYYLSGAKYGDDDLLNLIDNHLNLFLCDDEWRRNYYHISSNTINISCRRNQ